MNFVVCCCSTSFHIPFPTRRKQKFKPACYQEGCSHIHGQRRTQNGAFNPLTWSFPSRGRNTLHQQAKSDMFSLQFSCKHSFKSQRELRESWENLGAVQAFDSLHIYAQWTGKCNGNFEVQEPNHFTMRVKNYIMQEVNEEVSKCHYLQF